MAAPNSKTDICRLSMDHLKQEAVIVNIDIPTTNEEKVCSRWYDTVRRKLLRSHPWVFARDRKAISRNAEAPDFGYSDAYDLPNEFLNLRFIGDDAIEDFKRKYDIEGRQILINNESSATLNIGFTQDVTNVSLFDSMFVTVFALELAKKVSYRFTLKLSLLNALDVQLKEEKAEAKAVNGQDRPPIIIQKSKWITARRSLSSNTAGKKTVFHG